MTAIKKLIDGNGNQYFPQTHTKAVVDDSGYSVESRMQAVQDVVNQAQMAIGAVPNDLAPVYGSTNWVTSGGIYNAITGISGWSVNFQLTGDGSTYVRKDFSDLILGHTYKVTISPTDFSVSSLANKTNIYSCGYFIGSTETAVYATRKNQDTVQREHTFVAIDADSYYIGIRADSGTVVSFTLEDMDAKGKLSELEDQLIPLKGGDIINLSGTGTTTATTAQKSLVAGHKYRIKISPVDFATSPAQNGYNIYSLFYYVNDNGNMVFATIKGTDIVRETYDFTAEEADYYEVSIRAALGGSVTISLIDLDSEIEVDNTPNDGSGNLVKSGGVYKFVTDKFSYALASFSLDGQGNNTSSTYNIHLNEGETYTLRLLNAYSTSTITSGMNKYSLGYYISGSWTAVFTTMGSETEITARDYTFTAVECDSYEILIRGDVGEVANFRIMSQADDLTDVIEAAGASNSTDIISLNDENRTLRYLRSIKRPNYSQDGRYAAGVIPFTLLHFSDLHSDVTNLKRIIEYKEHYATYIDDAICTGDNIRNVFGDSYDFWSASGADDILISTGNHEYYNGESSNYYQSITPKQVYDKFFAPFISSWGDVAFPENASTNGYNYYYKDYTSQKVRLIVLDNMANMTSERNGVQAAWLATVLESARTSNLHVLCAIHIASTLETVFENPFTSYNIIRNSDSGVNSGSFSEFYTLRDAVEAFITNGGNFIGWIGGHRHSDSIAILTGYQQGAIHVATASSGHAWNIIPLGDDCDRTDGTKQQDSFNIYSVDTEQRALRIFKVGSDIDRNGRHKGVLLYNYGDHTVKHYD